MEVCMYRALTDVGIAHEKAEAVVNAIGEEIDMRVENAVNTSVNAMRADIAQLAGEMRSSIATLTGEMRSSIAALTGEMRSSIAALTEEMHSSIATLSGEIKRLDDKIDGVRAQFEKSIVHIQWTMGFVTIVGSTVANIVWRFI